MRSLILILGMMIANCAFGGSKVAAPDPIAIRPERTLIIDGPIYNGNIIELGKMMLNASAKGIDSIDIIINSPGGEAITGFLFINMMEAAKARGMQLKCFVPEIAASMAFSILSHCSERHALARSFLLWHHARVVVGGMFGAALTSSELSAMGHDLEKMDSTILNETIDALGIDPKVVKYHFDNETLHIGSDLGQLAPDYITIHDSIPGLYDALQNALIPRTTADEPTNSAGGNKSKSKTKFQDREIIYITSKVKYNFRQTVGK